MLRVTTLYSTYQNLPTTINEDNNVTIISEWASCKQKTKAFKAQAIIGSIIMGCDITNLFCTASALRKITISITKGLLQKCGSFTFLLKNNCNIYIYNFLNICKSLNASSIEIIWLQ